MQNGITGLERDLEDADEKGRNTRAAQLEQELSEFRKVRLALYWLSCSSKLVHLAS